MNAPNARACIGCERRVTRRTSAAFIKHTDDRGLVTNFTVREGCIARGQADEVFAKQLELRVSDISAEIEA